METPAGRYGPAHCPTWDCSLASVLGRPPGLWVEAANDGLAPAWVTLRARSPWQNELRARRGALPAFQKGFGLHWPPGSRRWGTKDSAGQGGMFIGNRIASRMSCVGVQGQSPVVGGLHGQAWGAQDCPHSRWHGLNPPLVLQLPLACPPWLGSEWAISQSGPGARSEVCGLERVPPLLGPHFPTQTTKVLGKTGGSKPFLRTLCQVKSSVKSNI